MFAIGVNVGFFGGGEQQSRYPKFEHEYAFSLASSGGSNSLEEGSHTKLFPVLPNVTLEVLGCFARTCPGYPILINHFPTGLPSPILVLPRQDDRQHRTQVPWYSVCCVWEYEWRVGSFEWDWRGFGVFEFGESWVC